MAQVIRSPKAYDVCIIGSGAGGGTAAKVLTEGGLSVVMLEAGPRLNPEKDFKEHVWPYQLPHRGVGVGGGQTRNRQRVYGAQRIVGDRWRALYNRSGLSFRWFRSRIEEAAPTTGDASRSDLVRLTSGPTRPTAWATTGRSATKKSRLITTRLNPTSAFSAPKRISPTLRTAFLCRRPSRDALRPS